jgi:magnesium-transporting ATPase (P-type)
MYKKIKLRNGKKNLSKHGGVKMNLNKQKKRIWKDSVWKDPGIWFWFFLSIVFFILVVGVWNQGWINRIGMMAFLVLSLYSLLLHLFSTKVALYYSGIRTANMKRVKLGVFKVKQKRVFIPWEEVRGLEIKNYLSGSSWIKSPRPFLILKTKDKKKYTYVIYDIDNFLLALKKIGKHNLLTKKTREKYNL